jgi:hypothetical protein
MVISLEKVEKCAAGCAILTGNSTSSIVLARTLHKGPNREVKAPKPKNQDPKGRGNPQNINCEFRNLHR